MKASRREVYRELLKEVDGGILCSFCRYSQWEGECKEAYCECQHPLEAITDKEEELYPGGDCWGFRPHVSLQDIADIVGIILVGHSQQWSWWIDNGQIYVHVETGRRN